MVSRNTTLVPSLGLRIGPACEVGLGAGMRKERVVCHPKRERKKERKMRRHDVGRIDPHRITSLHVVW